MRLKFNNIDFHVFIEHFTQMKEALLQLEEPQDYFSGIGHNSLPTPINLLMYLRQTKSTLQQKALQNRSHHRFVLVMNLETAGYIHVDSLTLPFNPCQALLILPYQFHHFSLMASSQLKWLFCTFELEPRTFLEPLRNRVVDLREETLGAYKDLLNEWHQAHDQTVQVALLRLLVLLKRDRMDSGHDLPPEPKGSLLRAINRLMAGWRGRTVVVSDLAEALDYSESRLRVLFKEAAGIPLGSYIQNYRLNRAMALLRTTELSIAHIAEEAGFGSPQAFSRIFKNAIGQTPRGYRSK